MYNEKNALFDLCDLLMELYRMKSYIQTIRVRTYEIKTFGQCN